MRDDLQEILQIQCTVASSYTSSALPKGSQSQCADNATFFQASCFRSMTMANEQPFTGIATSRAQKCIWALTANAPASNARAAYSFVGQLPLQGQSLMSRGWTRTQTLPQQSCAEQTGSALRIVTQTCLPLRSLQAAQSLHGLAALT